ncbi:MAG: hypothetical protein GX473_01940 [Candidatus Fermentibacter daniensis]|jgi:hypothetical protein|nr:hypothetical protein [Candidatus Fermentibacter daniensis]
MKGFAGIALSILAVAAGSAAAVESSPDSSLVTFLRALQTGDSTSVDSLISEAALSNVQVLLNSLTTMARSDPDGVTSRLASAGYGATASDAMRWNAREYLRRTVALPVMMARYAPCTMTLGEPSYDDRTVVFPVVMTMSGGSELETEAVLVLEDGIWKVSTFMGLNSFP